MIAHPQVSLFPSLTGRPPQETSTGDLHRRPQQGDLHRETSTGRPPQGELHREISTGRPPQG